MARSPLFDIYDPYGLQGAERLEDLLPEEEKNSMLRQLANAGASGLSGFGWLLDTPGAFVRGLLSEGPGKAISSLWEDSESRVTGRELLRQYGLAGEEDNWGNFGGGLATEILLDPMTYASLGLSAVLGQGAKTSAARMAARAGIMPDDIVLAAQRSPYAGRASWFRNSTPASLIDAFPEGPVRDAALRRWQETAGAAAGDLLNRPLARSHRVTLPGISEDATDLFGGRFGDWAAGASDRLHAGAFNAPVIGPAMRTAQAMFDSRLMGFDDAEGATMGRTLTQAATDADREAMAFLSDITVDAARDLGEDIFRSPQFLTSLRDMLEGQGDRIPQDMWDVLNSDSGNMLVDRIQSRLAAEPGLNRALGLAFEEANLPNDVRHFPRQSVQIDRPTLAPGYAEKPTAPPRGRAVADVGQGAWSKRADYTRAFPAWVRDAMTRDPALQEALRAAPQVGPGNVRQIIDDWIETNATIQMRDGTTRPWLTSGQGAFDWILGDLTPDSGADFERAFARQQTAYADLADSLRREPLEFASQGLPKYGASINDMAGYMRSMARRRATANVLLDTLSINDNIVPRRAELVPGGTNYSPVQALQELGFDVTPTTIDGRDTNVALEALSQRMGVPVESLAELSYSKEMVDRLNQRIYGARAPRESRGMWKAIDDFTDLFKTIALANPSRHVRDMYSGAFASATQGAFNPLDSLAGARAAGGDYRNLSARLKDTPLHNRIAEEARRNPRILNRLRSVPRFASASDDDLVDELVLRRFLKDSGGVGLTSQTVGDEMGRQAKNLTLQETFPGGAGSLFAGVWDKPINDWRTWIPYTVRGRSGNPNPLLDFSDRTAQWTDSYNRIGAYLNRIRKGDSALGAKRTADITQVLYGPENFTQFERDVMTRLFPFYRFTKGITPLVFQELTENPAGLMGQSIRTVNRLSEPSEDRHVPEYLRASAAIPVDSSFPILGPLLGVDKPGVTRFLTRIDLPQEGLLNMFSPGIGNTSARRATSALMQTGANLLGQSNPLLKGTLEGVTGKQFYTGRDLNDLYSFLEDAGIPFGRTAEQLVSNAPGGSRVLSTLRNVFDDRIGAGEKSAKFLFNSLTGMKFQDVDQDRTVRLAARTMLNELLDSSPHVSTFENISVRPEDIGRLSPEEQRQYLLYRVLQSESARRARERRLQMDPMAMLGVQ